MKKKVFWLTAVYVFTISFVFFGKELFAQEGPAPVEMLPLVNLDDMFDPMKQYFTDILKEYWVMLLSFFFLWFAVMCAISYLDGMVRRRVSIQCHRDQLRERQAAVEFEKQGKLEEYRRQLRESRYVERQEAEYHSRELNNIILRDGENFANIDGQYYVRSESYGVVNYKTLDQWRLDVEVENSQPLDFDNDDHGRIYDSIVDSDYRGTVSDADAYRGGLSNPERNSDGGLGCADEPLPYEEEDEDDYKDEITHQRIFSEFFGSDVSDRHKKIGSGFDDDSFERGYRDRQSQFRGGY